MTDYADICAKIKKMHFDNTKIIELLEKIKAYEKSGFRIYTEKSDNEISMCIRYEYNESNPERKYQYVTLANIRVVVTKIEEYYVINVEVETDFSSDRHTTIINRHYQEQDKVIVDFLHEHGLIGNEITEVSKMSPKEKLLYDIIKEGSVGSCCDGPYPIDVRLYSDGYNDKVYNGMIIAVIDKSTQVLSVLFYGNTPNEEKKSKIDINVPEERKGMWLDLLEKKGIKV